MCTLAWGKTGEGIWVCFNRDEQRSRPAAEQPLLHEGAHGKVAYARDPKGGGTWFAASSNGFAVALLNYYPEHPLVPHPSHRSRGLLVRELAECASAIEAFNRFSDEVLQLYPPFYLLLINPDQVTAFCWDGSRLTFPDTGEAFWTTSSFQPASVIGWRREWWLKNSASLVNPMPAAELLRQTNPDQPAYGVTMDRAEARTVSQILLLMEPGQFTFTYRERDPDQSGYSAPVEVVFPTSN